MLTDQAARNPLTSVAVAQVVLERVRSDVAVQMVRRHPMVDAESQRVLTLWIGLRAQPVFAP
jgi:hypothetical protein